MRYFNLGTASNNITAAAALTAVTATTLTFDTDDLAGEVISSAGVTVTTGQTEAAWMASQDAAYADINSEKIDISAGRARVTSSYSAWHMRRPASWFFSAREYQHDLHIPTWRKEDGDLQADIEDANGVRVGWDDRANGDAGTAARFSTLTTWANDTGVYAAQSLTRASEASVASKAHNQHVINLACMVNQSATELLIGQTLILQDDGVHASQASLSVQAQKVNKALKAVLLTDLLQEGPRASQAIWTPSNDDDFSGPEPTLTGVLRLIINGTIYNVRTAVKLGAA